LTTQLHSVPKLGMRGAILPVSRTISWRGA